MKILFDIRNALVIIVYVHYGNNAYVCLDGFAERTAPVTATDTKIVRHKNSISCVSLRFASEFYL